MRQEQRHFEGDPGDQVRSEKHNHKHVCLSLHTCYETCRLAPEHTVPSPVAVSLKYSC